MTQEELEKALSLAEGHPVRKALEYLLDERHKSAAVTASDKALTPDQRAHACGELSEVIQFSEELKNFFIKTV